MKNTTFYNASGLPTPQGNYSSVYDMALLTRYAMKSDMYKTIVGTKKHKVTTNYKTYLWENKNKLLRYDYITGGKTGYTDAARRTLVTTASKDNKNLVVVTLNDGNDFNDHKSLYETYFDKYDSVLAIDHENFVLDQDYYEDVEFYVKNDYYALVSEEEKKDLKLEVTLYQYEDIYDGIKIGEAKVMLGDTMLHTESIYARKVETPKEEEKKEGFLAKILRWFSSW